MTTLFFLQYLTIEYYNKLISEYQSHKHHEDTFLILKKNSTFKFFIFVTTIFAIFFYILFTIGLKFVICHVLLLVCLDNKDDTFALTCFCYSQEQAEICESDIT